MQSENKNFIHKISHQNGSKSMIATSLWLPFFPFLQTVFVRSLFRSVRLSIFQLKNSCEFLHKFMFDVWLKLNPRFLEFTWFAMQLFFSRSLCWNYIGIHFIICPFSSSNGIIGIFLLNISLTFQLCMLLWNFITQLKLHLWIANWMYSSFFLFFFSLAFIPYLETFFRSIETILSLRVVSWQPCVYK